jgi:hypothetical protein
MFSAAILFSFFAVAPADLIAELDAAWAARTPATRRAVARTTVDKLTPHRKAFGAAWRLARAKCWMANHTPYYANAGLKARLGAQAMTHAERAIKLKPDRVEGHYYHAWAVGQWSLGISIASALWNGAEGKITGSMGRAQRIDRTYDSYGILRMWGRYWHSLPWPKRNRAKALKMLRRGLSKSPHVLRGYAYLAEALIGNGEPKKACAVVARGLARPGDVAREADWSLWRSELKKLKRSGCKKLLEDL